mmetsp:Transcript_35154/g.35674  ORF Transcript_35154/g.35674 Transcript_35154/m.35674 type:complete len:330 (+) Transcript_35154:142-1131(+)
MASVSVEAMRSMIMIMMTTDDLITSTTTTSSSTAADTATAIVVSIPASPSTFEREREDVIIRSTNNHRTTILSIPSSAPMMPPVPMMPDLTTPTTPATPTIPRSSTSNSVFPRRRVNNKKRIELSNAQLPVPVPTKPTKMMKKTRSKQLLRHIKRGLLLEFLSFKHQEEGCSSEPHPQPQEESIFNDETMMTPKILLTPRVRMFHEEEQEEEEEQQQVTMIKPAAPWSTQPTQPSVSSEQQIVVTTTTTAQPTPSLLSASLNKALSVLSVSNDDDDDTDDKDDDDDDWGIFVSFGEEEHDRESNNNYDCYSPLNNHSYLPVFGEGLWIQ